MNHYHLTFGPYKTSYYLGKNCFDETLNMLSGINCDQLFIISDNNMPTSYGKLLSERLNQFFRCQILEFNNGEQNKNLQTLSMLFEQALSLDISRHSYLVGLGGGVAGNVAGMIAALMYRGIRWSFIPTSLMAMLDSSLSIKQAVNFAKAKNVFGTYYTPDMIITDISFLETLPKSHIRSGMCEVIKNALIVDSSYFEKVFQMLNPDSLYSEEDFLYVIRASIESKMQVMKNDPKEAGDALVLEYGHTIGHAIELASGGRVSHGDAIAIGMLGAAKIANKMGVLSKDVVEIHKNIIIKAGVSLSSIHNLTLEEITSFIAFDNKRGYLPPSKDHIHMVLLESLGKPLKSGNSLVNPVSMKLVNEVLDELLGEKV